MTAEPITLTPAIAVGDRVVVIAGAASDMPRYKGETGTVLQVFPTLIEVELDHFGYPACFEPSRLEVTP